MTRKQILQRQAELLAAAREEGRAMTAEEIAEFDALQRALQTAAGDEPEEGREETAQRQVQAERERVSGIMELGRAFGTDTAEAIDNGTSLEDFRALVLQREMETRRPAATGVRVEADEEDKFRTAAADSIAVRGGVSVSAPAAGHRDYMGMTLKGIAIECLRRDGDNITDLMRMSASEVYDRLAQRQFYNPTSSFPAIMDQTIRKSIVEMYTHVGTTFEQITSKGSLPDFKETKDHEYVIGGVGDFQLLPENGEIKPDAPRTELLPHVKLDTYAKQFSMTRQAFVNDDIGLLTRVPGLYAQAAKKTIDKQVYETLHDNPAIFDGKALFCSDHKNLIATGAAPSQAVIQQMILQLQKQTDTFGEPIYMNPRQIIVPVGWEFDLAVIFHSAQVVGSSNNDINPLYNYPMGIVQSPRLNAMAGANACPWFMQADEASSRGITVYYLNGQETPTVRRMETVGQLGFTWDMWLDWGVCVRDWRQFVKNPGVAL